MARRHDKTIELTYGDLEKQTHATPKKGTGVLWEGVQKATNHKLKILQKIDHKYLLLQLVEQTVRILQVRVDCFGAIADQSQALPADDTRLVEGVRFLSGIANKYAAWGDYEGRASIRPRQSSPAGWC